MGNKETPKQKKLKAIEVKMAEMICERDGQSPIYRDMYDKILVRLRKEHNEVSKWTEKEFEDQQSWG